MARSIAANVTVTGADAGGDLRVYGGGTPPLASTINYRPGQTRANSAIVPLSDIGAAVIRSDQASGTVHLILDVMGYFE